LLGAPQQQFSFKAIAGAYRQTAAKLLFFCHTAKKTAENKQ
jgi:hypothetical protein